ncbi:MAG: DISARM system phospholipase D-like protein DrmC [Actinomycetota bacterium]|nr:DISARM system phospholipase D-like protein DrmC [Actinomycetota bacterium]
MNDARNALVEQTQQLVIDLPANHVHTLADRLESVGQPTVADRHQAIGLVAAPRFRNAVTLLWSAWEEVPQIDGATVAMMLRSATAVASTLRASQSIDIAWTGPSSAHVPVRMTAQVLVELIAEARTQLFVVSYAAYKVAAVSNALRDAAQRGVDVRLILETEEDSGGRLSVDAADAFAELHQTVTFWVWPGKQRPQQGASMHAKAVVVDGRVALVTSANLTGAALQNNMELGLVIRGGAAPRRLSDHFLALTAAGSLRQVQPS